MLTGVAVSSVPYHIILQIQKHDVFSLEYHLTETKFLPFRNFHQLHIFSLLIFGI